MATTMIPTWELPDRLTKARQVAGISVQEMAQRLGISRTTISNYESGRTHAKRSVLIAWALATNVPLPWLETGSTDDPDGGPDQGGNGSAWNVAVGANMGHTLGKPSSGWNVVQLPAESPAAA